jgi:putative hydrolase of HD superfamily
MKALANFLFEVGMLKRTPRTGFQFLGSGSESVAEHVLRTVFISYALSSLAPEADRQKLLLTALFHDLPEARTGDQNYMNKKYTSVDEEKALKDALCGLSFKGEVEDLLRDFREQTSLEAKLARDADNIELLLQLKEQKDLGNPYAEEWIKFTLQRIATPEGKKLADTIIETDSTHWWFDKNSDWWISAGNDPMK